MSLGTRARSAAVIGAVGVMMAAFAPAQAPAQGPGGSPKAQALDDAGQRGVTRTRDEVEGLLDPAAVEYYSKTYEVDARTARERLIDQNLVLGLGEVLQERVGSDFGALSFDNRRGGWRVTAVTEAARGRALATLRDVGLAERAEVATTSTSATDLQQAARRIREALADVGRGSRRDVAVGVDGEAVVVGLEPSSDAARAREVQATVDQERGDVPARVERRTVAASPVVSCAFPYCDTLVAGTQWVKASAQCTIAFYVSAPGGGGNPHLLTAGHCVNPVYAAEEWFTCRPPGSGGCFPYNTGVQSSRIYGGSDSGLLSVGTGSHPWPNGWGIYPGYWNWSVNGLSTVRSYYAYNPAAYHNNSAPVGMTVCKNGRTTATTCGTITDNIYGVTYTDGVSVNNMLRVTMCSLPGDSGSPVTAASSETAVGIVSASTASGSCDSSSQTIAEPVGRALSQLGVQIYGG